MALTFGIPPDVVQRTVSLLSHPPVEVEFCYWPNWPVIYPGTGVPG